jgi:hypothetical protein
MVSKRWHVDVKLAVDPCRLYVLYWDRQQHGRSSSFMTSQSEMLRCRSVECVIVECCGELKVQHSRGMPVAGCVEHSGVACKNPHTVH